MGGQGDWISVLMAPVGLVMSRRDQGLPRKIVVTVSDTRVELEGPRHKHVASWGRDHVRCRAETNGERWRVWVQPPGERQGFELQARRGGAADAVVQALVRQ